MLEMPLLLLLLLELKFSKFQMTSNGNYRLIRCAFKRFTSFLSSIQLFKILMYTDNDSEENGNQKISDEGHLKRKLLVFFFSKKFL